MENMRSRDALIFELDMNKHCVEAYQELLYEAASCNIDRVVYCIARRILKNSDQDRQMSIIETLQKTCDILEMGFIKAPAIIFPDIFEIPKVGKVNEFGEVVSGFIGIPSLMDYQKKNNKQFVFIKKGRNDL